MSVLQNPLIGRAKQKLGGSVFTTWKGINVLKGKPLSVANPKTDKQLMRRSALSQIVEIGRLCKGVIDAGFNEQAVRKSAFNAFTGYNLRNGFNYAVPPTATVVPANLKFSQGTIAQQPLLTGVADVSDAELVITWDATSLQPGQSVNDTAIVVFHNRTTDQYYQAVTGTLRSANVVGVSTVDFPFIAGDIIDCYVGFYNATSRKSSDSVYRNVVAIA